MKNPGEERLEPWPECVYDPVDQQLFRCVQRYDGHIQFFKEHFDKTGEDENIWVVHLRRDYHDLSVSYSEKDRKILDLIERESNMVRLDYSASHTPNDTVVGDARGSFEKHALYDIRLQGDISNNCLNETCSCYDYVPKEKCAKCGSPMKRTIADGMGTDYCSVTCLNESKM